MSPNTRIIVGGDLWDDLTDTPEQAANMRLRSELMTAINQTLAATGDTQKAAAARLGLTQPRMSDLRKGHLDKFSLDALVTIADHLGIHLTVSAN